MQVREWHIVISGFLQRQGDLNGMDKVWDDMEAHAKSRVDARAMIYPWHCDVADIAELIARKRCLGEMPIVNIYGYSWGGMSSAQLCEQLRDREVDVNHLVLSDAVYRHWYRFGNWRALVPFSKIWIPDNVRRVTHFRQRECLPMGHEILAKNPGTTTIDPVRWLTARHKWMDDSPLFHSACRRAAKEASARVQTPDVE